MSSSFSPCVPSSSLGIEATICPRERSPFLRRVAQVWKWRRAWSTVLVPLSSSSRFFTHHLSDCEESQFTEIRLEMILASSPLEWREKELGSDQNARRAKFLSAMHCKERLICRKCLRVEKDGGLKAMQSVTSSSDGGKGWKFLGGEVGRQARCHTYKNKSRPRCRSLPPPVLRHP